MAVKIPIRRENRPQAETQLPAAAPRPDLPDRPVELRPVGDLPAGNRRPQDPDPGVDQSYSRLAGDSVAVQLTSTLILGYNPNRVYAAIVNDSGSVVYLRFGPGAQLNKGIRLNPNGGSIEFGKNYCPYTGDVYAIAAAVATITRIEL